jgi:uncharacterized membrane protein
LFIILPLLISLELLWWAFFMVDSILGNFIKNYFPIVAIPGLGLITLLLIISLTGLVAQNYFGKKLIRLGEKIVTRIPILKGIYSTTKQFTEGITQSDRSAFRQMVLVEYPRPGIYSPGFLTGESPAEASQKTGDNLLSVFIPMVPNPTTGFLILAPEEQVKILEMNLEDGLKLIISAGVIKPNEKQNRKTE